VTPDTVDTAKLIGSIPNWTWSEECYNRNKTRRIRLFVKIININ
jgi:hypothetical protein